MDIVGLIKMALTALVSFLELKNRSFYYDMVEKSNNKQQDLINEIEKLRADGTDDSNDRASILRKQLLEERQTLEHLSTYYTSTTKGLSGSN